ncbi:hypothetical protein N7466_001964 [Penicillium verhagenii]|uniref:uncharacterized protein n=1 Tax=Penicillium verhagenii TaxID=1562060 RepID=UPI0025452C95|nr:uncharacterized protein N7466_001964 [Penicillium verhagenii]KAJ5938830.1 hypothetical protein N7466_001964 [Penicillium verhagenii]
MGLKGLGAGAKTWAARGLEDLHVTMTQVAQVHRSLSAERQVGHATLTADRLGFEVRAINRASFTYILFR